MRYLTRTIRILSIISLLTDVASEMLYPVMPIYLRSIGFSALLIGILEGLAEATAGLSKGYFGKLSDQLGRRTPFIRIGYGLSALSKPMLAAFVYPLWIFLARTIDRLGKGIRTAARDALLSDESTKETKGRVFGFHRAMDTTGAVLGPAFALLWLYHNPGRYRWLFLIAFIPGLLAIACSLILKENKRTVAGKPSAGGLFSFLRYLPKSPVQYRRLVIGLWIFTLANSSDVFLLLRMKQSGLRDTATIGTYIFYNFVYALFAFPLGGLGDRIGLKKVLLPGLLLFSIVYAGMAVKGTLGWYLLLLFLYGLYAAATEGITKAWISNITDRKDTATAIGAFTGIQSVCTLLASTLTGWIWTRYGAAPAFLITAAMSLGVLIYIWTSVEPERTRA
ncbi:MAG: MFS transporter [Bacteroidetes bacterium]|nr:MFS transporter [Bacteroidota bacterium]